ncbi:hypothetical protein [Geodermatophilus sp. SYSU D00710]
MGRLLLWTGLAVLVVGLGVLVLLPTGPDCPYAVGADLLAGACEQARRAQETKATAHWVAAGGGWVSGVGALIQAVRER